MVKNIFFLLLIVLTIDTLSAHRPVNRAEINDLVYMYNGKLWAANISEWNKIQIKNLCEPIGLVIEGKSEKFIVGVRDWYEYFDGYWSWDSLKQLSPYMPTAAEGDIIAQNTHLRELASKYLGSDPYGNYYWTSTSVPKIYTEDPSGFLELLLRGLTADAPEEETAFIFCPGIFDAPITSCRKDECSNNGFLDVYRNLAELKPSDILTKKQALQKIQ